jgi:hypothetical protein
MEETSTIDVYKIKEFFFEQLGSCLITDLIEKFLDYYSCTIELYHALRSNLLAPTCLKDRPGGEGSANSIVLHALVVKLFKFSVSLFYLILNGIRPDSHAVYLNRIDSTAYLRSEASFGRVYTLVILQLMMGHSASKCR